MQQHGFSSSFLLLLIYLVAALEAAEGRALPGAPRDELKGPRRDLVPRRRDTDDAGHAPAAVRALQRRPHHIHVTRAVCVHDGMDG